MLYCTLCFDFQKPIDILKCVSETSVKYIFFFLYRFQCYLWRLQWTINHPTVKWRRSLFLICTGALWLRKTLPEVGCCFIQVDSKVAIGGGIWKITVFPDPEVSCFPSALPLHRNFTIWHENSNEYVPVELNSHHCISSFSAISNIIFWTWQLCEILRREYYELYSTLSHPGWYLKF